MSPINDGYICLQRSLVLCDQKAQGVNYNERIIKNGVEIVSFIKILLFNGNNPNK